MINVCNAPTVDCGHNHHSKCYCYEDQGAGYTYNDEYGPCDFCLGLFEVGTIVCVNQFNERRICPINGAEDD